MNDLTLKSDLGRSRSTIPNELCNGLRLAAAAAAAQIPQLN